jgi:pimeloyl-ACP methyl ester carboxylesterase
MSITTVTRDGVNLRCRDAGRTDASQAMLLVHGLNTNMAFWHPLLVRRLGETRRLVLYDQRGHGYSDVPPGGYTSSEMAEDARTILDFYELGAVDLVAHSFGAGVALQLARLYPGRVRSLILLDGRIRAIQPEVRLRDWAHFPRWEKKFADAGIAVDPNWLVDCTLPLKLHTADLSAVGAELQMEGFFVANVQKRAAEKYYRLMTATPAATEFHEPAGLTLEALADIRQPVLLVYGDHSPFFASGEQLAAVLPCATLEVVHGAGHNFPLNRPERTWEILAHWIAQDGLSTTPQAAQSN